MVIKTSNENCKYLYKSILELHIKKKSILSKTAFASKSLFFLKCFILYKKILENFYLRPPKVQNDPNFYIKLTLNFETQKKNGYLLCLHIKNNKKHTLLYIHRFT